MANFRLCVAGVTAEVESLFASTQDYCRKYLTEGAPALFLTVCPEELEREQALLRQEALEEGLRPRKFPDPFLERSVIQRKLADALLEKNILMFHGSTVAVDGVAYLFTAACGTGKSTHTRLWRQVFGSRAVMVNDDKPFLRFEEGRVIACGAPWSGKHGLDENVALPLGGICILERGKENEISPLAPEDAGEMLRKQAHAPLDPQKQKAAEELVSRLPESASLWKMYCTMDPEAAVVAYRAMSGKE